MREREKTSLPNESNIYSDTRTEKMTNIAKETSRLCTIPYTVYCIHLVVHKCLWLINWKFSRALICLPCLEMWRLNHILKITIVRQSQRRTHRLYWYLPMNEKLCIIHNIFFETFSTWKISWMRKKVRTQHNLDNNNNKKQIKSNHAAFKLAALIYFSFVSHFIQMQSDNCYFSCSQERIGRDAIGDDHFAWFDHKTNQNEYLYICI